MSSSDSSNENVAEGKCDTRLLLILLGVFSNVFWIIRYLVPLSQYNLGSVLIGLAVELVTGAALTYYVQDIAFTKWRLRCNESIEHFGNSVRSLWWGKLADAHSILALRDLVYSAGGKVSFEPGVRSLRDELKEFSTDDAKAIQHIRYQPEAKDLIWKFRWILTESRALLDSREVKQGLSDKTDHDLATLKGDDYDDYRVYRSALDDLSRESSKAARRLAAVELLQIPSLLVFLATVAALDLLATDGFRFLEFQGWIVPSVFLVSAISLLVLVRSGLGALIRLSRRWRSIENENLISTTMVAVIAGPTVAYLVFSALATVPFSFRDQFLAASANVWANPLGRVMIIGISAWIVYYLIEDGIAFVLNRGPERLGLTHDIAFVSVVKFLAGIYILIAASAALVLSFREELGITSPDTLVIAYVFVGSIVTGFVGYASRESLDNFFAGLMLRVNPPFIKGDRIVLSSGEVCDVRELGTRTVKLYNIESNTEIYVPNKTISGMTITNVSRPDLELRIQLPVDIRIALPTGRAMSSSLEDIKTSNNPLTIAEFILIDVAYSEKEVDQMYVDRRDMGVPLDSKTKETVDKLQYFANRGRSTMKDEISRLKEIFPKIESTHILTGEGATAHLSRFVDEVENRLNNLGQLRAKYEKSLNSKESENARLGIVGELVGEYRALSSAIYSVSEEYSDIKEVMDSLMAELAKEPVVHSSIKMSGTFESYAHLTLSVFAIHLERRFEVEHSLNQSILERFGKAGLLSLSP